MKDESSIDKLKRLVGESKEIRNGNLSGKKKQIAKKMKERTKNWPRGGKKSANNWFKSGPGGKGDLPPGYSDKDTDN